MLYTPRVWGRRKQGTRQRKRNGNTPTCVGKTRCSPVNVDINQKHPHVRGEDGAPPKVGLFYVETPPRAWGRPPPQKDQKRHQGNTPTCVGKTAQEAGISRLAWKHPHVRGEDRNKRRLRLTQAETPPRAWGRRSRHGYQTLVKRNTPTCVGKTGGHCARCVKGQKHPHVRGEDVANIFKQFSAVETPPRAWGRHCRFIDDTRCRENVKVLTFF